MKSNTCPSSQLDVRSPVLRRAQEEGELSRLRASVSCGLKTIICKPQNKPKTIQIKGKTNQNKPKSNQNKCFFQAQSNASYAQKFRILFSFPAKQLPVVLRSQRAIRPIAIGPIAVGRIPSPRTLGPETTPPRLLTSSNLRRSPEAASSEWFPLPHSEPTRTSLGGLEFEPYDFQFISYFGFSVSNFAPHSGP